jgi:hypothetical protein
MNCAWLCGCPQILVHPWVGGQKGKAVPGAYLLPSQAPLTPKPELHLFQGQAAKKGGGDLSN